MPSSVNLQPLPSAHSVKSVRDIRGDVAGNCLAFCCPINPPIRSAQASPNWAGLSGLGSNWTILTGIDFPSPGYWEIADEYLDQSLTFVVEVIDCIEWRAALGLPSDEPLN